MGKLRAALRARAARGEAAARLYHGVVAQARLPAFYRDAGVPDNLDGRFDLIVLHLFVVLHRLKREGAPGAALGRRLVELMVDDMDRSLREIGVGDLSVGRKVKQMARATYGRIAAYEGGLHADPTAVTAALRRNLYGTATPGPGELAAMAAYLRRAVDEAADLPAAEILTGMARFPPPPATSAGDASSTAA